jgi:hypothetical protein
MFVRLSNLLVLLAAVTGCGARTGLPVDTSPPCTGSACACGPKAFLAVVARGAIDKIDLVLAVDDSASMADKQAILALAIPDLAVGLANPRCLDDVTNQPVADQPMSPLDACPPGSTRDFKPVTDIHIGLLSSSLGTFGADGCPDKPPIMCPTSSSSTPNDDHGHLVTRADPCGMKNVPTYQGSGFLAWDPAQKLSPPGEPNLGDPNATPPVPGLATSLRDLVVGDSQLGCGFESQDESWFRFLVDPSPYASIALQNNQAVTSGTDTVLLQQRKEFLRPDSLLAIMVVSDETDTSIKQYSSYPLFGAPEIHLPRARQDCVTKGPSDLCCVSCAQPTPTGCAPDPLCQAKPSYTGADENVQIRAFGLISHKQRYGIEFFYQPSRYVNALTSATVPDISGTMVENPIFAGGARDSSLVFYAAVVGVPWQLIARQRNGVPDLVNGVSAIDPSLVGGFKTPQELALKDAHGNTFWDDIVGDPESYVPPLSPFMVESTEPRSGVDPITGAMIMPVTTPNGMGSMVGGTVLNDHEFSISQPPNVIEYACVFPIPSPVDCSLPNASCDCQGVGATTDLPVCAPNPNDGMKPTLQVKAKAYPGLKELAIAKGMGDQGIAASICAKQLDDPTASDYGYRPSVKTLLDRLSVTLGEQCLTKKLEPNAEGQVQCAVFEARNTGTEACNCDAALERLPVPPADACYVQAAKQDPRNATAKWNCFCEITQTSGAGLSSCVSEVAETGANGWCYVDPTAPAPFDGNPALVRGCPEEDRRVVRFVGNGAPAPGSTIFIGCN